MARYSQGPVGAFIGKIGPVVGGVWKGKPYMRGRWLRKAQPSAAELLNRNKFKELHIWLQPLIRMLRIGFKGYSPTVEGYNAAKSYNLKNAVILKEDKYEIDPSRILISYGSLPLSAVTSCEVMEGKLHVSWDPSNPGEPGSSFDRVMIVAYKPGVNHIRYFSVDARRKDGSDIMEIAAPGSYHVYLAFFADDRTSQSNSCYLGVVEAGWL
jgi:hypothetical protein